MSRATIVFRCEQGVRVGASFSHRVDMFLSCRVTARTRRMKPPVTRLVLLESIDPGGAAPKPGRAGLGAVLAPSPSRSVAGQPP